MSAQRRLMALERQAGTAADARRQVQRLRANAPAEDQRLWDIVVGYVEELGPRD
jgi:hypothetical protein